MIKSLARNTDNDLLKNRESQNSIENYFNKSSEQEDGKDFSIKLEKLNNIINSRNSSIVHLE